MMATGLTTVIRCGKKPSSLLLNTVWVAGEIGSDTADFLEFELLPEGLRP